MPETDQIMDAVSKEWLQSELRAGNKNVIILDCRGSNEYLESHIRSSMNFSIPSIMLRRFAANKIDLQATIKSRGLKQKIDQALSNSNSIFVLYQDTVQPSADANNSTMSDTTINVLHRRLKQDGSHVVVLEDNFSSFFDAFPEWCESETNVTDQSPKDRTATGTSEQLMGLRSLRISPPYSDSACSSSTESSDCESTTHSLLREAPVEILPYLFLGNASHSGDSKALQKYNIKYVLNVTPDLPNVFEKTGNIQYLQIPITDHWSQDLAIHFPNAIRFIDEARTKGSAVLVHCLAGVSRSVTITLAYLMHTNSLCLNDAFLFVRARKPDVSPNFHFMEQLHSFERQLLQQNKSIAVTSTSSTLASTSAASSAAGTPISATATCSSAATTDSGYLTTPASGISTMSGGSGSGGDSCPLRPGKYACGCMQVECKCMKIEFLGPSTGVSPDSGIEFDRWTAADGTPK